MKLYLVDLDSALVHEWQEAFSLFENVHVVEGDYFSVPADLMVSPANSFGFMDGGLDLAIRNTLGVELESKLQEEITNKYYGELAVGQMAFAFKQFLKPIEKPVASRILKEHLALQEHI